MVRSPESTDSDVRSKKHKKHKKHNRREHGSSQDDEHHRRHSSKHTHGKDYDEPLKKKQKKDYHDKRQSSSHKGLPRSRCERGSSSRRKQADGIHSNKVKSHVPNNIQIKNEDDFDKRQEELRKARQVKIEKTEEKDVEGEKEKPNLGLSGALTEDTNTYKGVVIKYNEPPEARQPKRKWRLYPFKGTESLKILHLHRQSAYLLGRQRRIADIPIDHPSCSKQHAVLQFRCVVKKVDGVTKKMVRPYVIDLGSGNGTYLNNAKIDPQRYYELKEQDVLKFGFSSREYVLLHAKSDTSEVDIGEEDDDVGSDED